MPGFSATFESPLRTLRLNAFDHVTIPICKFLCCSSAEDTKCESPAWQCRVWGKIDPSPAGTELLRRYPRPLSFQTASLVRKLAFLWRKNGNFVAKFSQCRLPTS